MVKANLPHAGDDAAPSAPVQQQQTPSEQLPPQAPGFAAAAVPQVESEAAVASARAIEGSAFSTWREFWSLDLEAGCSALQTQVHALQSDFDEASVFIRGDLAWRQQLGRFHDKVNDVLYAQIEVLRGNLKQNADLLSLSVAESLGRKDVQTKLELSRQTTMYEGKLRRTRTSLKKEIDRFTHLEKCLRKEEAFQAKEMYDALVLQLTTEHEAKETALHALLNELRSSYSAMELSNTHLMESLKAARKDAERMKKILIKQTSDAAGSLRKSSVRSPTRSSGTTVGGAPGIQDVYVQSLKQALSTSAQTIEGLKKQVAELTADKENCLRKVRLAEDATSKVNDELAKVTQLLSESHAALIANKKTTEQVESETAHWKDLFVELQFRTESNAQEIEAAKKLADATRDHIAALEMQVKRLENVERQKWTNDTAFAAWLDQEPGQRDLQALEKMAESFINGSFGSPIHLKNDAPDSMLLLSQPPVERERQELETKLRYEFEKRYGEALNLRLNHERKRVLTRIEMLCAMQEQQCEAEATTRQQQKFRVGKPGKVSYRLVHKIVSDAYDHLGFSEWSATDLNLLHAEIESLQAQLVQQHMKLQRIERFAEAQGMALAKADLLQQEKEFLLAELTDKYRELRATKDEDALGHQSRNNVVEPATELVRFDEKPLTVYGHPQRLELKKCTTVE
uniref:Uncharacterized protein n=1 Tax=Globisporangium ultimum (strain ATCC 200006 / CBS 805.95 / DAOM BR144) TaxID=431595 RepID=K3X5L9_GLOUD